MTSLITNLILLSKLFLPLKVSLKSEDYGKHLLGVQDLLHKHTLSEADITTQTERARSLKAQAQRFVAEKHPDSAKVEHKSGELDAAYQRLQSLSSNRLNRLKVGNSECLQLHVPVHFQNNTRQYWLHYSCLLPKIYLLNYTGEREPSEVAHALLPTNIHICATNSEV